MAEPPYRVPSDHRRQKNKFIPPIPYLLNNLKEVSWIKDNLPEVIWLALLHSKFGEADGRALALQFVRECVAVCKADPKPSFGTISSFLELNEDERLEVRTRLRQTETEFKLVYGLGGFLAFYPDCPLNFIIDPELTAAARTPDNLIVLKTVVGNLYDKFDRRSVMAQAELVYLGRMQNKIKIAPHLSLAKFSEIEKYPHTELSKVIASSVRAMLPDLIDSPFKEEGLTRRWPKTFWDTGLKIDSCEFLEEEV